jgi:hypothetical protein
MDMAMKRVGENRISSQYLASIQSWYTYPWTNQLLSLEKKEKNMG